MGFFSQDCERCGHPALSYHASNAINRWMEDVTVIRPDGSMVQGRYDGYGRVGADLGDGDPDVGFDATVWHTACWEVVGKPAEYRGHSRNSCDQGFFFGDEHDVPDPRTDPGPTEDRFGGESPVKDRLLRQVVVVGWDGHSQRIYRYHDELHLPDHMRSTVPVEERKSNDESYRDAQREMWGKVRDYPEN